jgi:molybdopterin converting factor small subunit
MRLVFLGKLGDVATPDLSDIALPGGVHTLADLKDWIVRGQPSLGRAMAAMPVRLIVNHSVAHDLSVAINDSDEIAFLPPMSGG